MRFKSLNGKSPAVGFEDAIFLGLAPDGGMYVPEEVPQFTKEEIARIPKMSLHDIATLTLHKWLRDDFTHEEVEKIVHASISYPIPLVDVGGYKVLELFHGPTLSFKDLPLRLLAHIMKAYAARSSRKLRFLIPTTGDTGSAIAHSFSDIDDAKVVVVYPKNDIDPFKKEQLTRISNKIFAIEVDGDYNDVHLLIEKTFGDKDFAKLNLSSANSINIGRVIPQLIYYIYLYSLLYPSVVTPVIPTDNFGNATTILMAKLMGIPFGRIILACEDDHPIVNITKNNFNYLKSKRDNKDIKHYQLKHVDNFPRMFHLCGYSKDKFIELFEIFPVSTSKTHHMMHVLWHHFHYLSDPNTATAWVASDSLMRKNETMTIIAMTSPYKFARRIKEQVGIEINDLSMISELRKRKMKVTPIANDFVEFKKLLIKEFTSI